MLLELTQRITNDFHCSEARCEAARGLANWLAFSGQRNERDVMVDETLLPNRGIQLPQRENTMDNEFSQYTRYNVLKRRQQRIGNWESNRPCNSISYNQSNSLDGFPAGAASSGNTRTLCRNVLKCFHCLLPTKEAISNIVI